MKRFKLVGYDVKDIDDAIAAFCRLVELSAKKIEQVSMKFCANSAEEMAYLLGEFNHGRFSMFSWKACEQSGQGIFDSDALVKQVRVLSGDCDIRIAPFYEVPLHVGDGEIKHHITAAFGTYQSPESASGHICEKNEKIENGLKQIFSLRLGDAAPVEFGFSSALGSSAKGAYHVYRFSMPPSYFVDACKAMLEYVPKSNSMISIFEHEGTLDELLLLQKNGCQIDNYPPGTSALSTSSHGKPFSFAPVPGTLGWIYDIPNCSLLLGFDFFRRSLSSRKIHFFQLGVSYIPWNTTDGMTASPSQGNQLHCMIESGKIKIFVGLEQYNDHDVPVRKIRKSLEQQLNIHGIYLK